MKIYDVTGKISEGLWNYGPPFPDYRPRPLPQPEWVEARVWCDIFEGMNSQTGTYLETPAHLLGPESSYNLDAVDIARLVDLPVVHLKLSDGIHRPGRRAAVTVPMLEEALGERSVDRGKALIISCGWGRHWFEADYLEDCPYITRDAMEWIVRRRPFLLGSDIPRWENLERPEGIFPIFYAADILMLAPLVIPEDMTGTDLTLTALPIRVTDTCCAPCRAIIRSR